MQIKSKLLQRKLNNSRGFTLAETLVALAIIVILLSISMLGIINYVKNMKVTEMDSTARQIFAAAQNHLTSAKVTGRLNSTGSLGTPMSKPADFPDTAEDPKWPGDNNGEYYYIAYSPNDSAIQGNLESSILKDMLPFGAIDETVRVDGSYIIEYNIKTASVYGVFYTDNKAGVDSVDVATLNAKGGRSDKFGRIVRRDHEKDNKRVTTGYYGGAMLEELEGEEVGLPLLEIENKERLLLKITDDNFFTKKNGTQLQTEITVKLTGEDSQNSMEFVLELDGNTMSPNKKNPNQQEWWTVDKTKTADNLDALQYEVCLDDITVSGGHFVDVCDELVLLSSSNQALIPGENITVDVSCTSNVVSSFKKTASGMTNSLFGSSKTTTENASRKYRDVEVSYIRHLQNLDPFVSDINDRLNDIYVRNVMQIEDMDWKTYYGIGNKSISKPGVKDVFLTNKGFYGIYNASLAEYNGSAKTLRNFPITSSDTGAGLFRQTGGSLQFTNTFYVHDLKLEGFDVTLNTKLAGNENFGGGALIGNVNGNLQVEQVAAVATTETVNGIKSIRGSVNSESLAGGLIGNVEINGNGSSIIENCTSTMIVRGKDFTGGMIGSITKGYATVTNSYVGGHTENGGYSSTEYNVYGAKETGGFIGHVGGKYGKLSIFDCYSTASVGGASGVLLGGFIGKDLSLSSSYDDCYTTGLVKNNGSAGAFASYLETSSVKECKFLEGINGTMNGDQVNSGKIKSVSYKYLSVNKTLAESYPYDSFLKGSVYPFAMVNKTGAKDLNALVHYGDWPIGEELIEPTDVMFAYYDVDKWYVKGATAANTLDLVKNDFYPGYGETNLKRPTNAEYGLLVPTKTWSPSLFTGGSGKKVFAEEFSKTVEINGEKYYFFPVDKSRYKDDVISVELNKENITVNLDPDFVANIKKG